MSIYYAYFHISDFLQANRIKYISAVQDTQHVYRSQIRKLPYFTSILTQIG